jgi:hypothetical protein
MKNESVSRKKNEKQNEQENRHIAITSNIKTKTNQSEDDHAYPYNKADVHWPMRYMCSLYLHS